MRYLPVLATLSLAASACSTEPVACPSVLTAVTAEVLNGTTQPVAGLVVTDTVLRTGAVLRVSTGSAADTLLPNGIRRIPIISDLFADAIARTGDEVVVVVTAANLSVAERYRFAFDGCAVEKVTGPDTLVVS